MSGHYVLALVFFHPRFKEKRYTTRLLYATLLKKDNLIFVACTNKNINKIYNGQKYDV